MRRLQVLLTERLRSRRRGVVGNTGWVERGNDAQAQ